MGQPSLGSSHRPPSCPQSADVGGGEERAPVAESSQVS